MAGRSRRRSWSSLEVPVQTANEDSVNVRRLRETQELVDWIHRQSETLLHLGALKSWVQSKQPNPWWELLQEALDAYGQETPGLDSPGSHFVNCLAEWEREVRRKQSGVLLLTAPRAIGLEFDHVAILDGKWNRDDANNTNLDVLIAWVKKTRAKLDTALEQRFGERAVSAR